MVVTFFEGAEDDEVVLVQFLVLAAEDLFRVFVFFFVVHDLDAAAGTTVASRSHLTSSDCNADTIAVANKSTDAWTLGLFVRRLCCGGDFAEQSRMGVAMDRFVVLTVLLR